MNPMMKGLRRLAGGGILLREIRGLRHELTAVSHSIERIATALETYNQHQWPHLVAPPDPSLAPTEITFVDTAYIAELAEIEMGLTGVRGVPPSEDEVMAEYHRRHQTEELPPPLGVMGG